MPYRRGYRKRRKMSFGRKSFKKYFKRKRAKYNKQGLSVFKLRSSAAMTTSVLGTFNSFIETTAPDQWYSGTGSVEDWSNLVTLYDQYRVCAISIKFIPQRPNDTSLIVTYHPLYMVPDFDDTNALNSAAQAIQYERMKVKNLNSPWKVYFRIPKVAAGSGVKVQPGYFDIASSVSTGAIKFWADSLTASTTYGTFIATYYVACKNRR